VYITTAHADPAMRRREPIWSPKIETDKLTHRQTAAENNTSLTARAVQKVSKTNPRSVRCFSPESIPGVSIIEMLSRTGLGTLEHWNRLRNALPNLDSGRNCFLGSTTSALPGTTPSVSPCITAIKRSVVGSGPIRRPGKSYKTYVYITAMNTLINKLILQFMFPDSSLTNPKRPNLWCLA